MSINRKSQRAALIEQLVQGFTASLAFFDEEQLEAFLHSAAAGQPIAAQGHGVRARNNAAMIMVNPEADKSAVVAGIEEAVRWLEQNWDELAKRRAAVSDEAAPTPAPASSLPN